MRNSQKQREAVSKINYKHGFANKEKLYGVWKAMKDRCNNPNNKSYKNYGGRGIKVCNEWSNNYDSFREWAYSNGYNPNGDFQEYTIDRIDNNGNYEPSNCRWVTNLIQAQNKQNSIPKEQRTRVCTICGKSFTIRSLTNPAKTCSRECGNISRLLLRKKQTEHKYKKECPICHKMFEDRSGHFKTRVCCSKKCSSLSLSPIWDFNGEVHRVLEWAEITGINAHCLLHRKEMGWTIEEILLTPKGAKRLNGKS